MTTLINNVKVWIMIVVIYLLLIGVNSSSASTDSILSYNINYHQIGNNSCSSIDISENNLNNYDLTINLTKPPLSMNNWNWEGISNSNTKTGTLLEQNEITVTKEIYVKNINKLNLLPYTSLFSCFNISQYLEYVPYILLIYPDPDFFINNVGVSEGVGFRMVNITTPWYLFSLEFVYKLEASGGWNEIGNNKPLYEDYGTLNDTFTYHSISGILENQYTQDGLIHEPILTVNISQFIQYEEDKLVIYNFQILVDGTLDNKPFFIDASLSIYKYNSSLIDHNFQPNLFEVTRRFGIHHPLISGSLILIVIIVITIKTKTIEKIKLTLRK